MKINGPLTHLCIQQSFLLKTSYILGILLSNIKTNKQNDKKKSLSWIKLQAREQDRFVNQYIMMKVSYFKSRNNNTFLAIYTEISIEKLE